MNDDILELARRAVACAARAARAEARAARAEAASAAEAERQQLANLVRAAISAEQIRTALATA